MNQPADPPARPDRLLQNEERLRLLFEDAPVPYHELDIEGRIARVNRAECAMLGYEPSELIGKHAWELVSPGERSLSLESVSQNLSGAGDLQPIERRLRRKTGELIAVEIYQNLILDAAGRITGIRGILINMTERQRTIEAMLASESRFRELFDNVMDGVYQSTADGKLLTV